MTEDLVEHACNVKGRLFLTSAWGGPNSRVVQLTVQGPDGIGYCVMTYAEAKKMLRKCARAITKTEKKYDANPPWWEQMAKKTP